ncbi:cyclic AMP-dependent transcription factor ATF-3-like [Amphiura filiformis]|uniref:cyclic AMP-dependent transcription factor ATF-3-like n=1 Tax=Amphiura filiformis TaxID=82378 RepID=UPI003B2198B0
MFALHQSVIVDASRWQKDDDDSRSTISSSSSQDSSVEPGEDILAKAMLKEEIRCNIMEKRMRKGLGNINVDWKSSGSDNLSSGEEDKRRTRRERNRLAASRCRERRREKTYVLVQETEQLESSNRELVEEIQRLEIERQQLMAMMESHRLGRCQCAYQSITREDLLIDP